MISEWLARGRQPLFDDDGSDLTVVELLAAYKDHAEIYYRKNGQVTNEVNALVSSAKVVISLYGRELAREFGPLKLQAVQQAMIRLQWCRKHINKQVGRVVRIFAWGVSQELVPPDVANALREVKGLHKGRTEARESVPVLRVAESSIQATLHDLPPIVADMVRLHRFTGCRPDELCIVRPCDVDTSGPVWAYRPDSHKTEHHGRPHAGSTATVARVGPRRKRNVL